MLFERVVKQLEKHTNEYIGGTRLFTESKRYEQKQSEEWLFSK